MFSSFHLLDEAYPLTSFDYCYPTLSHNPMISSRNKLSQIIIMEENTVKVR